MLFEKSAFCLCCRWQPLQLLHLVAMFRDVPLSDDQLRFVLEKVVRLFPDADLQEMPPLVYQLLVLASKVNTILINASKVNTIIIHASKVNTILIHTSKINTIIIHASKVNTILIHASKVNTILIHASKVNTILIHHPKLP